MMQRSNRAKALSGRRIWGGLGLYVLVAVVLSSVLLMRLGRIDLSSSWAGAWGVALLLSPAVFLAFGYGALVRSRARVDSLERLYSFAVRLGAKSDTADVVESILDESRKHLDASYSALRLPTGLGGMRYVLRGDHDLRLEIEAPTALEEDVAARGRPVPGSRSYRPSDVLAVPVPLGDLGTAVMVVGGRLSDAAAYSFEDLRFLEAFAANFATSLISSQRLDQLRREVAAREHQALHDALTGLGNRTLFTEWVEEALISRRQEERVGVLLMDLDGFKDINDTLGHQAGDAVLEEVAARILAGFGPDRLAARLGGDEFALVIPAASSAEAIAAVASELLAAVSQPVAVGGMDLEIRASVGIAVAPDDGSDVSTLLRRSDVAMYAAKTGRKGLVAYDREIDQYARRRLVITNELRRAMDSRQLEIWYQPLARLGTGEVTGMEALLRWRHAEYGPISPMEFVPVAEQSGLIEPITWWVLESALGELAAWRQEGFDLTMSVNLSGRCLTDPDVARRLAALLAQAGIPAADLTLEVTETVMMADPDGSRRVLDELGGLGVQIAIDDFGTGYSSLARLTRLAVHTVKIDRSFVIGMHRDEADEAIVRATIELARNMGHEVIAEGVERQDTWDRLSILGCNLAQGHLLAPAMPIDICRSWLRARQSPQMAAIHSLRPAKGA